VGMFPARVYAGQMIAVFAIVIVAIRGASRWAAAALGYQAALGPAWFTVLGFPVCLPWRLFEWWYACAWQIKLVTARRWANVKEIVAAYTSRRPFFLAALATPISG
jgi:type IV secretory pathway TraG/TraD family ATPase VirD4